MIWQMIGRSAANVKGSFYLEKKVGMGCSGNKLCLVDNILSDRVIRVFSAKWQISTYHRNLISVVA